MDIMIIMTWRLYALYTNNTQCTHNTLPVEISHARVFYNVHTQSAILRISMHNIHNNSMQQLFFVSFLWTELSSTSHTLCLKWSMSETDIQYKLHQNSSHAWKLCTLAKQAKMIHLSTRTVSSIIKQMLCFGWIFMTVCT